MNIRRMHKLKIKRIRNSKTGMFFNRRILCFSSGCYIVQMHNQIINHNGIVIDSIIESTWFNN